MSTKRARTLVQLGLIVGLTAALAGCGPTSSDDGDAGTDTGSGDSSEETTDDGGDSGGDFVTVSGDGTYVIGEDIPLGGFQLEGEPDAQPDGCRWQILDADGAVTFENSGQYVWFTDIPEAVTFVTAGCPDWEQFEE